MGINHLCAVEHLGIIGKAVEVAVFPGKNGCSGGAANRIGYKAVVEQHPFIGNPVQVRRLNQLTAISAHRLNGMVICHDEHNIWPFSTFNRFRLLA
ncbi:hypothetical protein D3C87_1685530 [compost metagenome]